MYRIFILGALVPILSACISTGQRDTEITPARSLSTLTGSTLSLDFPSGEIRVKPSDDAQLHASVRFFCDAKSNSCRRNAENARIVHEQQGELSTVSFRPGSAYSTRHAHLIFDVQVPDVERLEISADAGEIAIVSPTGCLSVKAKAGDLSITAPATEVRSVALSARAGDANLRTPAGNADEERPLLVGSRVLWEAGAGHCHLSARLTAGGIDAALE